MKLFIVTDYGKIEIDSIFWRNLNWRNPRLMWITKRCIDG
jgi:hypothetical protein